MTIVTRWRALGACLASSMLSPTVLPAQEPGRAASPPKAEAPAAKRAYDPARRVPDFFGQIGLTPEQREAIYKARTRHQARIAELEKQIAEVQAQSLAECEAVLTEAQKQLLAQRRKAAESGATSDMPEKKAGRSN